MSRAAAEFAFDRSNRTKDVDGRLFVADCNISKANVCPYLGREIPEWQALGLDPTRVYHMYRDPVELEKAASTFNGVQLLIIHKAVSAEQPEHRLVVGSVGTDCRFEAPFLKASINVWTQEAIDLIEREEQRELSSSYRYRAEMLGGTLHGATFDGRMLDIRANHVALVTEGRAGSDVKVADSIPPELQPVMKHAARIAAMKSFLAPDADLAALDAQLEVEHQAALKLAQDAKAKDEKDDDDKKDKDDDDDEDDDKKAKDEENESQEDPPKPKAKDRAKDKAKDKKGKDKAMDAQTVTVDEMKHAIKVSTAAAVKIAIDEVNAMHLARAAVAPFVGTITDPAMDSAEKVYGFALTKKGVAIDGVHASAFPAMLALLKTQSSATDASLASDAALSAGGMLKSFPALSRIRVAA